MNAPLRAEPASMLRRIDVVALARQLGPQFAEHADDADENDRFVAANFEALKTSGLVEAAVPAELGGGGANVAELAAMLRELARHCASTALAFAMHTHQVAIPAWRWRHQNLAAAEPLLKRVANERIMLLSSGGSDWIAGSGEAVKVDGGYRISGRKVFTSGAASGNLLMTGAIVHGEDGTASVIHFGVPMSSPAVKIVETWRAMGMRGTGSNDVVIDGLFVPDASVALTRKSGEWHPLFQIISTIAFPLIYAVYLGVAENARDMAIGMAKKKRQTPHTLKLAGEMDTTLRAAQLAHRWMMDIVERNAPSADSVNEVMMGRTLVAKNAIQAVELAMELAGGASFYRANGLERCFRDVQGARFHPLQAGPQAEYAGAMALGVPTATIF
ncbi:acyl-CoA dehydrogenase family protein [Mesorhizobium yinganensis]|uniref:acyl-CoA dehydrogenase family protein n=1 Tax=Mesorhizobium yinganensis TaxID=3157707 RepID=UPI0032B80957